MNWIRGPDDLYKPIDGGDEAIASSRYIGDVTRAGMAVAGDLSHSPDVDLQVPVLNECLLPSPRNELFLADCLSCALYKNDQDVKGPTAKPDRLVPVKES